MQRLAGTNNCQFHTGVDGCPSSPELPLGWPLDEYAVRGVFDSLRRESLTFWEPSNELSLDSGRDCREIYGQLSDSI
jgi:hypothetical protein